MTKTRNAEYVKELLINQREKTDNLKEKEGNLRVALHKGKYPNKQQI